MITVTLLILEVEDNLQTQMQIQRFLLQIVTRPREYPDGFVYMDMGLPQFSFSKIFANSHQALTCSSSRSGNRTMASLESLRLVLQPCNKTTSGDL